MHSKGEVMTEIKNSNIGGISELDNMTESGHEKSISREYVKNENDCNTNSNSNETAVNSNSNESKTIDAEDNIQSDTSSDSKLSKFAVFQNHKAHSFIALPIRFYLAYVFISACIHKLAMPEAFAVDIATYQFLPLVFINPLAIVLPYVELCTGAMLILGARARAAALMVCGMMVMFMIALSFALFNDLNISCGCFASNAAAGSDPISGMTMLRDTAWLLLGLYVVIFDTNPIGIDRLIKRKKNKTA